MNGKKNEWAGIVKTIHPYCGSLVDTVYQYCIPGVEVIPLANANDISPKGSRIALGRLVLLAYRPPLLTKREGRKNYFRPSLLRLAYGTFTVFVGFM